MGRVRVSVSQRYTPTQRFTQYPPRTPPSFMGQREGREGCCVAFDGCEVLCFSIHQFDELDRENFNFEQFYQLYLKVCGRLEIEHLCFKW